MVNLKREIEEWRATRVGKGPMPAALWERTVELAGEYGAYATAGTLKVSPGSLYDRMKKSKCGGAASPGATFVEVGRVSGTPHPLVLEVTGERGQKLSLRLHGEEQLSSVLPLVRECWGQR